jgi:hypothetical protein
MVGNTAIKPSLSFDQPKARIYACYRTAAGGPWTHFNDETVTPTTDIQPMNTQGGPTEVVRIGLTSFPAAGTYLVGLCGEQLAGLSGSNYVSAGAAKVVAMIVQ